jgi:hypothetical protein
MLDILSMPPREAAVIETLGESDPTALTLADIADTAGGHVAGYGTSIATLRAQRLVGSDEVRGAAPLYRLLPRGQAAYRQLQQLAAHRARSRRVAQRHEVGVAA